jgi:hypothetical protein
MAAATITLGALSLEGNPEAEAAFEKSVQLKLNKAVGDAWRDTVADQLKAAGRDAKTEVRKDTPFGPRVMDVEASERSTGKVLGGVETKTGKSPVTPSQRAKDNYLKKQGHPINYVRKPEEKK